MSRLFYSSLLDHRTKEIEYIYSNNKSDGNLRPEIKNFKGEIRKTYQTTKNQQMPQKFIFACDSNKKIIGHVSFAEIHQGVDIKNIYVDFYREDRKEIENELMRLLFHFFVKPHHLFVTMTTHPQHVNRLDFLKELGFQLRATADSTAELTFIKMIERPSFPCKL